MCVFSYVWVSALPQSKIVNYTVAFIMRGPNSLIGQYTFQLFNLIIDLIYVDQSKTPEFFAWCEFVYMLTLNMLKNNIFLLYYSSYYINHFFSNSIDFHFSFNKFYSPYSSSNRSSRRTCREEISSFRDWALK